MPRIDLSNKPIVITGASAGIGAATALACARAGMPVVCAARRIEKLEEVVGRIRSEGGRAVAVAADVADPDSCERMVQVALDEFGSVYSVFANAGYGVERAMHEMSDEELRAIFETNFFGTMNSIRPALPHMLGQGAGHVIICSSCLAKFSLPYYGAYAATKAAQNLVGRAMDMELRPRGVRVSTVHPIGTKTEFFDVTQRRSGGAPLVEHSKEMFMQRPETVARAVVRCLRRARPEVWTSRAVWWGMAAAMAVPSVSNWFIRGMVKQRLEAAPPKNAMVSRTTPDGPGRREEGVAGGGRESGAGAGAGASER